MTKFRYPVLVLALLAAWSWTLAEENVDSTETERSRFIYPYAFYTPETNLAFGVGGISYFRSASDPESEPSKITLSGYYTLNNQFSLTVLPDLYLQQGEYILSAELNYGNFIDKFYGVGNKTEETGDEEYVLQSISVVTNLQKRGLVHENIGVGLNFEFTNKQIIDKKDNEFLQESSLLGVEGGSVFGIGLAASLDTRDNVFYPSVGWYFQYSSVFFSQSYGSDYDYNRYIVDVRLYLSILEDHILAFQTYGSLVGGSPPFYELAALGGPYQMRGYYEGRYRDKTYITTQMEYRTIIWNRLGVAAFAGVGDVSSSFSNFVAEDFKYSYGFGLRYTIDMLEKLNVRMDIGLGKNTKGVYFAVEEAF